MGRLDVRVCEARHIPNNMSPYVVVVVENQHNSTHVAPQAGSTSAKWESAFKFNVHDDQGAHIRFELWNRAAEGDEFIGVVSCSVTNLTKGVVKDAWFALQRCKVVIELRVRMCALDFGGFIVSPDERRGLSSAYSPQLEVPPANTHHPGSHQVSGPTPTVGYRSATTAPMYH